MAQIQLPHQGSMITKMRQFRKVTIEQVADALEKKDSDITDDENSIYCDYHKFLKWLEYYHFGIVVFPSENKPDLTAIKRKDEDFVFVLKSAFGMPENRPPYSDWIMGMRLTRSYTIQEVADKQGKSVAQVEIEEMNRFMPYHDFAIWANYYGFDIAFLPKEFLPLSEPPQ